MSAIAGVPILASVNLTEDPETRDLPDPGARLQVAVERQREFLNGLLTPTSQTVIELRIRTRPAESRFGVALLVRADADEEHQAEENVREVLAQVTSGAPTHVVTGTPFDHGELLDALNPFGEREVADAAFLTRDEITGVPQRADLRQHLDYYFSVTPWHYAAPDWSRFYQRIADSRRELIFSVALYAVQPSVEFAHVLDQYATAYGQMASLGSGPTGLYTGEESRAAESFAIDAAPAFQDYALRLRRRAFLMRVMLASPEKLPLGLADVLGATVSPPESGSSGYLAGRRSPTGHEVRGGERAAKIAQWDLEQLDVGVPDGSHEIWEPAERGAPPDTLRDLAVLGDARDAACAFRLPIAAAGMLPGFRVRRGASGQAEATDGGRRPLNLGTLRGQTGNVRIDADSLTKHALVAGSTGSGKTTLVIELLRQLWEGWEIDGERVRVPFLVIEPVNSDADDYRRLLELPGFEDVVVVTVGDERFRPLRFNPFATPHGVLVSEHMSSLLACFKAAFGLWDPLPAIYEEAIADTYMTAGILPSAVSGEQPRAWPTVVDFQRAMGRATADLGYKGEVKANLEAASVIRAKQLVYGPCASTFRTDLPLDVEWLLGRPVIVELKTLGSDDEQALMMALLINAITAHYKANRGAQRELVHVTVIEEAHRLLRRATGAAGGSPQGQAKEQAAEAFANVLAENRKYGEGIIIAEQIPSKLVEDAVKNTNLKVMARLTSEDERVVLGQAMAMSPEQAAQAARLSVGEAFVYSDQIANATEILGPYTVTGDVPLSLPREVQPPLGRCTACLARCDYRASGLAVSRRARVKAAGQALATIRTTPPTPAAGENESPETLKAEWEKTRSRAVQDMARAVRRETERSVADESSLLAVEICAAVHVCDEIGASEARASMLFSRLTTHRALSERQ